MADTLGNVEILVSPQELQEKAGALTESISAMEQAYANLTNLILRTSSYWEGTAADRFRRLFTDNQTEIEGIIQRLKDHPNHLLQISGNIAETESGITEQNMALPSSPLD